MRQLDTRKATRLLVVLGALAAVLIAAESCSLPSAPTDRYAIIVGIDKYLNARSCSYTENDAVAMQSKLAEKGWTIFDIMISADPSTYYNPTGILSVGTTPTKAAIKAAIQSLVTSHPNASSILFYYSGHGDLEGGNGYVCPYDTILGDTSSMISVSELDSWINESSAPNKLVILDSCYSGAFAPAGSSVDATPSAYLPTSGADVGSTVGTAVQNSGELLAKAFSDQSDPTILTLAAAGSREESYGDNSIVASSSDPHGVFTYYLLNADKSADSDGNSLVTATEAFGYARAKILSDWDSSNSVIYYGEYFLPHLSGGSGDIVLYDNR